MASPLYLKYGLAEKSFRMSDPIWYTQDPIIFYPEITTVMYYKVVLL